MAATIWGSKNLKRDENQKDWTLYYVQSALSFINFNLFF